MIEARFLQIHTLHSYTSALLNRDDSGLAKRLPYGGAMRTRISSQCLKRHWRLAKDPHALARIDGASLSIRSRDLVDDAIIKPLRDKSEFEPDVLDALQTWFNFAVYGGGDDAKKKPSKRGAKVATDDKKSRQTLLFGAPELDWLASEARRLAEASDGDADRAFDLGGEWQKEFKKNIEAMRDGAKLPAGLSAAMFGRMVTSDAAANIDAPIHVAHAFTVHEEESESDYFTAVDDLKSDDEDGGADTIQETELTSGLFYGYVVIDVDGLVENTTGIKREAKDFKHADRRLAAATVHNLLYLIAEVSPGAKLGSTAPYGRAELMLVEAGDRQPRSLAAAFREPADPIVADAQRALVEKLRKFDEGYATGEARRALHFGNEEVPGAARASLAELATWARDAVQTGEAG